MKRIFALWFLALVFATPAFADWYIVRDHTGAAIGHVNKMLTNPLLEPRGLKKWYTRATLIDPQFNPGTQIKSGPVYDTNAGTITYKVRDKTAAELSQQKDAMAEEMLATSIREGLVDWALDVEKRLAVIEGKPVPTRAEIRDRVKQIIRARLP